MKTTEFLLEERLQMITELNEVIKEKNDLINDLEFQLRVIRSCVQVSLEVWNEGLETSSIKEYSKGVLYAYYGVQKLLKSFKK